MYGLSILRRQIDNDKPGEKLIGLDRREVGGFRERDLVITLGESHRQNIPHTLARGEQHDQRLALCFSGFGLGFHATAPPSDMVDRDGHRRTTRAHINMNPRRPTIKTKLYRPSRRVMASPDVFRSGSDRLRGRGTALARAPDDRDEPQPPDISITYVWQPHQKKQATVRLFWVLKGLPFGGIICKDRFSSFGERGVPGNVTAITVRS